MLHVELVPEVGLQKCVEEGVREAGDEVRGACVQEVVVGVRRAGCMCEGEVAHVSDDGVQRVGIGVVDAQDGLLVAGESGAVGEDVFYCEGVPGIAGAFCELELRI